MSRIWIAQHVRPFPQTTLAETSFFVIISVTAAISLAHAICTFLPTVHAPRMAEQSILMEFISPETPAVEHSLVIRSPLDDVKTSHSPFNLFNGARTQAPAQPLPPQRVVEPRQAAPQVKTAIAAVPATAPSVKQSAPEPVAAQVVAPEQPLSQAPSAATTPVPATATPTAQPLQLQNFNGVSGGDFGAQTLPKIVAPGTKLGNIAPYKKEAFTRIIKFFHAHSGKGTVGVRCTINKDGSLTDSRIVQSSGVQTLDDDVLEATHSAAFDALPDWFTGQELRITFVFDCDL
jgi:TonB family protein